MSAALRALMPRLLLWLLLLLPFTGLSAAKFPPPELDPSLYTMPQITTPAPRAHYMEYVDVFVLFAALSLGTYLVMINRRRKWIFWLMLFSLGYFGFYRQGCVCPIGSIQNVTLAVFNPSYIVPLSVVIFFFLPLAFTVFFGRAFCAAVCPLGAMQDVVLWKPIKLKPWLEQALGLVPFVYLSAAVLFAATSSAFIICEYDPFVSFFRRGGSLFMLLLGAGFLLVGMFIGRPYCRFLCPYGAILSLLSRISKWNVYLTPDDCIRCEICEIACPYGAIAQPSTLAEKPKAGQGRLIVACLLLPALIFAGAWLGGQLSVPFSKMNRNVRLAERIAAEDTGKVTAPAVIPPANALPKTERNQLLTSKAFRQTGAPPADLFVEAARIRGQFVTGGWLLGAFIGLVVGGKLLSLAKPQPRSIYEPDRATCLACGRCYSYCPKELVKVKRSEKKKPAAPAPAEVKG